MPMLRTFTCNSISTPQYYYASSDLLLNYRMYIFDFVVESSVNNDNQGQQLHIKN